MARPGEGLLVYVKISINITEKPLIAIIVNVTTVITLRFGLYLRVFKLLSDQTVYYVSY